MSIERTARLLQGLGYATLGVAAVLGLIAWEHMRTLASYGVICGGAVPHCPACPASVAALALGSAFLVASARLPRRLKVKA